MTSTTKGPSTPTAGFLSKDNKAEHGNSSGGIFLTERDVVRLRNDKIQNWPNPSELWALKYGIGGLALTNVLSNSYINSLYRAKFALVNNATRKYTVSLISSLLVTSFFPPAASASFLHLVYFERLLQSSSKQDCPICLEVRALTTHLAFGSLVPTALAWLTSFYHASLYYTVRIPNFESYSKAGKRRQYFREIYDLFKRTNRNVQTPLIACFSIQIILSSLLFYLQQNEFRQHIEPSEFSLAEIKRVKT